MSEAPTPSSTTPTIPLNQTQSQAQTQSQSQAQTQSQSQAQTQQPEEEQEQQLLTAENKEITPIMLWYTVAVLAYSKMYNLTYENVKTKKEGDGVFLYQVLNDHPIAFPGNTAKSAKDIANKQVILTTDGLNAALDSESANSDNPEERKKQILSKLKLTDEDDDED